MHDDDTQFSEFLKREVQGYAASTPAPANEMWAQIEGDVANAIRPTGVHDIAARRTASTSRRIWISVGVIAAALVIGVGVGRWSSRGDMRHTVAVAKSRITASDSARTTAHTHASAMAHLAETEEFLTAVRSDLKTGRTDADRAERSRELLARTRLLMGSADRSPEVTQLLEDLELLLAEIAAMPRTDGGMDRRLLDDNMRDAAILPRIRTMLPAQSAGT